MMKRMLVYGVCLVMLSAGCATLSSVQAERGRGTSRMYVAPFETVWEKTLQATNLLGLGRAVSNEQEGYILAETGISAFSWGEKIAIFIDRVDESRTRVEVVSRKVVTTNVFAFDWEPRILDKLDELLARDV